MRKFHLFVILLIFCLAFTAPLCAVDMTAAGGWTGPVIDSCPQSEYESDPDSTIVNIINTVESSNWRVSVRASYGAGWPNDVCLSVRPTAAGQGSSESSPIGVGVYVAVTTSDTLFFESKLDRTGVAIQYRLSGLSVSVPPGTYSTTVTFTVVEI